MFASAERLLLRYRTSPAKPVEMGKIISPPESLWNQGREFTILEYIDGTRPRGTGEKWILTKYGVNTIKKEPSNLVEITDENFNQCLAVTKERVSKFQNDPWKYDEAFEIKFPEKEKKIRDEIRDYLFGVHAEQEKLTEEEKQKQKDPIIIRVREIDHQYLNISQGRYLKVEFINLIIGHSGDPSTPPPLELYTVTVILPIGVDKQSVFSEYSLGESISFEDEEMWMITIPTKDNYHPMFPIARDLFQKLSAKSLVDERINKEQVEETIKWIDEKISTDTHPGTVDFDGQDPVTGHFYKINKEGKRIFIIRYFDNEKSQDDFIEHAEKPMWNKPTGFVNVFKPEGGGLSAGTSKNNPDQKNFENWMVVCPNGSIHEEMSKEALINFWQENFPEIPLIMPEENIQVPIIPELRIDPKQNLIVDPFLTRSLFSRTETNFFISPFSGYSERSRNPVAIFTTTRLENKKIPALAPAFIFPIIPFATAHAAEFVLPALAVLSATPIVATIEAGMLATAATVAVSVPAMINDIIYVDFPSHFASAVRPAERITTIITITPNNTPDTPNGGSGQDKIENKSQDQQISSPRTSSVNRSATITGNTTTVKNNHNIVSEVTKGNLNVSCDSGVTSVQELDQTSPISAPIKTVKPIVSSQVTNENTDQPALSNNEHPKTFSINNPYKFSSSIDAPKVPEAPQIEPSFSLDMPTILQPNFGAEVNIFPGISGQKQFFDLFTFPFIPEADINHEVFKQFFGNLGNYQPAVYAMGMIFIVLLNLLTSGATFA